MAVQLASSLLSAQSWYPSQWKLYGMHRAFEHRNWAWWQGGKSEEDRGEMYQ